jgi:toxin CcdB
MQFDVHVMPGRARDVFPYFVDVQSELASEFGTRYIVPLLLVVPGVLAIKRANPMVEFAGQEYLFVANQLANIATRRMGAPVGNLAPYREDMVSAIDFMITGF